MREGRWVNDSGRRLNRAVPSTGMGAQRRSAHMGMSRTPRSSARHCSAEEGNRNKASRLASDPF
eukprot:9476487-Pyramimonas_sp.AAC.1